jgi:hypothetical protein
MIRQRLENVHLNVEGHAYLNLHLEMENDTREPLKVVLRLTEEACVHIIAFGAQRQPRVDTIINPAPGRDRQSIPATARCLRL